MSTDKGEFGSRLRYWRMRRAFSQRELATLAGLQQVTIARIEGRGERPRPATIRRLAEALHLSIEDLIGYADSDDIQN
jgi:transcriptional regulator with XRE-family HTH domain